MRRTLRSRLSATTIVAGAVMTVGMIVAGSTAAQAVITTPGNGAVVRGNGITIHENSGGQDNCAFGNSGDDTRILIDGIVRFGKGDGGAYTVSWNTLNAYTNGTHTITSQGRNISNGFFSCSTGSYYNISTITVNIDNRSFLTYTGATNAYAGENFTAAASLSLEGGASNVGGRTISFCISGGGCTSAATNASGVAAVTLNANGLPGPRTVSATYGGDPFFTASSTAGGFSVLQRPTVTTNLGDTSVFWNEDATLRARVNDQRNGAALGGKPVTFQLLSSGGSFIRSVGGTTDGAGIATATLTASENAGSYLVKAVYGGEALYVGSSDADAITILPRPTALVYTGDDDGFWTEDAAVSATLTDVRSGATIGNKPISFALGTASAGAPTDAAGSAVSAITLGQDPGAYTVTSSYAGENNYIGSGDTDAFTILKRPTTLTYDGATSGPRGSTVTLSATLTDDRLGGAGVAGKTIHFTLGSFSGDATTGASGQASIDAPLNQDPNASYTVDVSYDEDAHYLASSDTDPFNLGWEYTYLNEVGDGTVYLNTSTREFRFSAPGDTTSIITDPAMKVIWLPDGATPPCDPNAPEGCVPPPPPLPCDPNAPEGCLPPPPPVPDCVDDPTGGDPICPEDYIPQSAVATDPGTPMSHVCVTNPIDNSQVCAPDEPNDVDDACDAPQADGCSERFAIVSFQNAEITIAGFFDLQGGAFAVAAQTPTASYALASKGTHVPPPPPPPCDVNAPEGCVPPPPPPPPAPCDINTPEGCIPPPPPTPECVENPAGGEPICKP